MHETLLLLEDCAPQVWGMLRDSGLSIKTLEDNQLDRSSVSHLFTKLNFQIDEKFLEGYQNLKSVVTPTTAINHIDADYCSRKGIEIISLRDTNNVLENFSSTSEIATWIMLSLSRVAIQASADVKSGSWSRNEFIGNTLRGKNVGIVGYGRLGKQFSQICASFGMKIFAYDLLERSDDSVIFLKSLKELVGISDFVSLHVDDRAQNQNLINADLLSHFRSNGILINTSRGFIVDENAIVDAVRNDNLKAYGTDVLSGEHGENSDWLRNNEIWKAFQSGDPRFLILPHIGGAVQENIPTAEMAVLKILVERFH
jgi:D-3-phosphoglycerate dehydrogenase